MTWNFRAALARLLGAALLIAACLLVHPAKSQACRDCPFPMKIGDNQWLMPDSHVVVGIYESDFGSSTYVTVELRDQHSGDLLATGSAVRTKKQRSLTLTLRDPRGRKVNAKIHWVNYEDAVIQAKFECDQGGQCSIHDR